MPDLPTLTVTQAQADRMLAAWGSASNYKEWLKNQVIAYVVAKEDQELALQQQYIREAQQLQTRSELTA
jgi:hypothetical protein